MCKKDILEALDELAKKLDDEYKSVCNAGDPYYSSSCDKYSYEADGIERAQNILKWFREDIEKQ